MFSRRPRARAPHAAATLKFLAVLLAAGMLAFLGAIICIIASVHPAGTAAPAAPTAADNDSAAAALLPAADKGLGALHGPAEALASAGPRLTGSTPLFSRFVCTPLSAECPAAAPGPAAAGPEELLALRSAAAQLRRTALEQKERIRMDQETIRELTGKLSRCEGGLHSAPPAAGLRAAPRPGTMGHPPAEPPAVRELEDAVRALQERIDRIEVGRPGESPKPISPKPALSPPDVPATPGGLWEGLPCPPSRHRGPCSGDGSPSVLALCLPAHSPYSGWPRASLPDQPLPNVGTMDHVQMLPSCSAPSWP